MPSSSKTTMTTSSISKVLYVVSALLTYPARQVAELGSFVSTSIGYTIIIFSGYFYGAETIATWGFFPLVILGGSFIGAALSREHEYGFDCGVGETLTKLKPLIVSCAPTDKDREWAASMISKLEEEEND